MESLASYSPWGVKELDMTERLSTAQTDLEIIMLSKPDFMLSEKTKYMILLIGGI